jgi:hypothetical protein
MSVIVGYFVSSLLAFWIGFYFGRGERPTRHIVVQDSSVPMRIRVEYYEMKDGGFVNTYDSSGMLIQRNPVWRY